MTVARRTSRIGGLPFYIQGDERQEAESLVCVLSSMEPHEVYPFTNVPELPQNQRRQSGLMIGDVGCVYFVLDRYGNTRYFIKGRPTHG